MRSKSGSEWAETDPGDNWGMDDRPALRMRPESSAMGPSRTRYIVSDIVRDMPYILTPAAATVMKRTRRYLTETRGASEEEGSPRYHVAPRGLLFFYALLSIGRKPMSGYALMRDIEDKTEGAWRPGPGAIYPTLKKLARLGYVRAKRKSGESPTLVSYEITAAGLRNIARAKEAMESSGERMRMMSSLFIDLMEPDDLVKFALNSFELQAELVRTITEAERSRLSDEDRLFVLRRYRLSLDRDLARAAASIRALEAGAGRGTGSAPRRQKR